jgi:hypothetical protein
MPAKKSAKNPKFTTRQLASKSRTTARKAVTKTRATARKTMAKGKAIARKTTTMGKTTSRKSGTKTVRSSRHKTPRARKPVRRTSLVGQLKKGVQSGLDTVGRMVQQVTPNVLLPKSART